MIISFVNRLAQVVKVAVGIGMCLTYPLQLFVAIQIMWPNVQQRFGPFQHTASFELLFRTFMVFVTCKFVDCKLQKVQRNSIFDQFSTVVIAELVPHLNIFISLIGALCSTGKWFLFACNFDSFDKKYIFSFIALALVFPPVIQLVLAWGSPDGPSTFLIAKNAFILIFSIFGFVTGTYESILSLIHALFDEEAWETLKRNRNSDTFV